MNTKACLVQLLLFILLVVVLALVIKRFVLSPAQQLAEAPVAVASEPKLGVLQRLLKGSGASDQAATAAAAQANAAAAPMALAMPQGEAAVVQATQAAAAKGLAAAPGTGQGIDGLTLQLSRPLMFDVPRMRGMAINDTYLYLSITDPAKAKGFVYQLDRDLLNIKQMRTQTSNGRYQLGGLHLGQKLLWTALTGDTPAAGSHVLGLDPITLEERVGFDVAEQIVMVAEGPDEILYGFTSANDLILVWSSTGYELRRQPLACGARYNDVEVVGESLICVGVEPGRNGLQGVIDVLDASSLSLLKRHPALGRSANGEVITSKGFAYDQGVFLFAPDQGVRPRIVSYVPQAGVSLDDYIMHVAP